jgi:hypothetical protein
VSVSYEELIKTLADCEARAQHEELSLGQAFDDLKESTFSLICLILCLPFIQPISLGPLATIGGLTFAALGWQLANGRTTPWLPEKIRSITPGAKTWQRLLWLCRKVVSICGRLTRPRHQYLLTGERGDKIIGLLIVIAGLLMAIPFFGIPFNNTLPALAIIAACMAELEDDGLFIIVSIGLTIVTVAYFCFIFYALFLGLDYVFDVLGVPMPRLPFF